MDLNKEITLRLDNIKHTLHADPRGSSCLLLSSISDKPVHIVCAPHEDALTKLKSPSEREW